MACGQQQRQKVQQQQQLLWPPLKISKVNSRSSRSTMFDHTLTVTMCSLFELFLQPVSVVYSFLSGRLGSYAKQLRLLYATP